MLILFYLYIYALNCEWYQLAYIHIYDPLCIFNNVHIYFYSTIDLMLSSYSFQIGIINWYYFLSLCIGFVIVSKEGQIPCFIFPLVFLSFFRKIITVSKYSYFQLVSIITIGIYILSCFTNWYPCLSIWFQLIFFLIGIMLHFQLTSFAWFSINSH